MSCRKACDCSFTYVIAKNRSFLSVWMDANKILIFSENLHVLKCMRDFPGSPVVKTSPSNAEGTGSIPGRGANIPHASWPKNQNIKQKQYCNKFSKDFKNGPHKKKNLKNKCMYHKYTI